MAILKALNITREFSHPYSVGPKVQVQVFPLIQALRNHVLTHAVGVEVEVGQAMESR